MWDRIKRVVRSNMGRFKDDPLGAGSSDLKGIRQHLATVREHLALLERDHERLVTEEAGLAAQIRAALDAGRRDAALSLAEKLRGVREDKAKVEDQLAAARRVCAKAERLHGSLPAAAPSRSELEAAADETLARLEASLNSESQPAARPAPPAAKPEPPRPAVAVRPRGKTIGEDSGPLPLASASDSYSLERSGERPAPKTIGDLGGEAPSPAEPELAEPEPPPAPAEPDPPPAPQARVSGGGDLISELERLGRLKEQGLLTPEEFDLAKRKLLGL